MEITINLLTLAKIWFIPGLIWTLLFTGIYTLKAIKGHRSGELPFDKLSLVVLVFMFFTSWIGWPWSLYYNLPPLIMRVKKTGKL